MKRKKNKLEVSEFNPVPLYRSYGVTRKERRWAEILKLWLIRITAGLLIGVPILAITVGLVAALHFASTLAKTMLVLIISFLIISSVTKKARDRIKFNKKLKKLCHKENFHLDLKKSFFDSLSWSSDRIDFTVETESRLYVIRTLPINSKRQRVLLDSKSEIFLITPPHKFQFPVVFDVKPRKKRLSIDPCESLDYPCDKEQVQMILILPECSGISYRQSPSVTIPTGNGGEHFGFTVFNTRGFLNYLPRHEKI